jgi:hypothetical protein
MQTNNVTALTLLATVEIQTIIKPPIDDIATNERGNM